MKQSRTLVIKTIVAAEYGGDMDEEMMNSLLDAMDFDRHGRVKCRKIEQV